MIFCEYVAFCSTSCFFGPLLTICLLYTSNRIFHKITHSFNCLYTKKDDVAGETGADNTKLKYFLSEFLEFRNRILEF